MSERIPPDQLDLVAVAKADQQLWKKNPELRGRSLTMDRHDRAYREQWMKLYHQAQKEMEPPPPTVLPEPVPPPPPVVAESPKTGCHLTKNRRHAEKMKK